MAAAAPGWNAPRWRTPLAHDRRSPPFGLAGFVQSKDPKRARAVANRIRAGRVYLNGAAFDRSLPFGGYKQSGNGREFGIFGFEEYLEVKAVAGSQQMSGGPRTWATETWPLAR